MVAYARAHSPYYRVLYKDLPDRVEDPTLLPVTNKKQLMARFDDWVTDRRNLGTFKTRGAAEKHERAVQFFKHG